MSFQDEMKQMFLRVAAGEVEPEEWEKWWKSNRDMPEKTLHGETGCGLCLLYGASGSLQ